MTLHAPMSSVVVDFQPIVVAYIGKKKKTTTTSSNIKQKNYYALCLIVTEG